MSALDKNVEDRTRKDHLAVISLISKTQSYAAAIEYWVRYGNGISRKTFEATAKSKEG